MAIRLEFLNLIVPVEKIDSHYPGGFSKFLSGHASMLGGRLWDDAHLFRDGAMNPRDMQDLVDFWSQNGLKPFEEKDGSKWWKDMCVVDFFHGPTLPCDWLEFDSQDHSVFLKGTAKGEVIGRDEMKGTQQGGR